ncbi:hypothetical protein CIPAW_15G029300 [Carya illinoinensis]|uniref:ATP synthase F0 subunit 8 n=1 Tax=Carya illinoinensis TaxID=32201 RepID=A0A8T1NB25_CARIL|nr:hypothetical protein CIPAW_15G029300 [Carya illinoinensis]
MPFCSLSLLLLLLLMTMSMLSPRRPMEENGGGTADPSSIKFSMLTLSIVWLSVHLWLVWVIDLN